MDPLPWPPHRGPPSHLPAKLENMSLGSVLDFKKSPREVNGKPSENQKNRGFFGTDHGGPPIDKARHPG